MRRRPGRTTDFDRSPVLFVALLFRAVCSGCEHPVSRSWTYEGFNDGVRIERAGYREQRVLVVLQGLLMVAIYCLMPGTRQKITSYLKPPVWYCPDSFPAVTRIPVQGQPGGNSLQDVQVTPMSRSEWDDVSFVISSRYRIATLRRLSAGPATPSRISEETELSVAHVSRALQELKEHELVDLLVSEDRKKGRVYGVTDNGEAVWEMIQAQNMA